MVKQNRPTISKKIRFEIFKRDSFTCQYCGKSAPTVILNVDHVVPVSGGGDSKILNLVTSCFDCNSGKGKRKLSDDSTIKKQSAQANLLNERKNQINLLAKWHLGLSKIENTKLEIIEKAINSKLSNLVIPDSYLRTEIKSSISRFGLEEVLIAIEKSANQYLSDPSNSEIVDHFLRMIPRICYWSKHEKENPEIAQIRKIAYSATKNWWNCNAKLLIPRLLSLWRNENIPIEDLYFLVKNSSGIIKFEENIKEYLNELGVE